MINAAEFRVPGAQQQGTRLENKVGPDCGELPDEKGGLVVRGFRRFIDQTHDHEDGPPGLYIGDHLCPEKIFYSMMRAEMGRCECRKI